MIANSDFNLAAYAERVGGMTDAELSAEGKQMRRLVYPKRVSGTLPSAFESRWRFVGRSGGGGIHGERCNCKRRLLTCRIFALPKFIEWAAPAGIGMLPPLDVFRVNNNQPTWLGTVESLSKALELIRSSGAGAYFVFSQETGHKNFYKVNSNGVPYPVPSLRA